VFLLGFASGDVLVATQFCRQSTGQEVPKTKVNNAP